MFACFPVYGIVICLGLGAGGWWHGREGRSEATFLPPEAHLVGLGLPGWCGVDVML